MTYEKNKSLQDVFFLAKERRKLILSFLVKMQFEKKSENNYIIKTSFNIIFIEIIIRQIKFDVY
jgi:hypothetical protein